MGNGSWTGILGLLRNDQCDFVVGGFFPGNNQNLIAFCFILFYIFLYFFSRMNKITTCMMILV